MLQQWGEFLRTVDRDCFCTSGKKKKNRVVGHSSDGVTIPTLNNKSYNKYANTPHAYKRPFVSNGGMPTLFESNLVTTKDYGLNTSSCGVPRQKPEGRKTDK